MKKVGSQLTVSRKLDTQTASLGHVSEYVHANCLFARIHDRIGHMYIHGYLGIRIGIQFSFRKKRKSFKYRYEFACVPPNWLWCCSSFGKHRIGIYHVRQLVRGSSYVHSSVNSYQILCRTTDIRTLF